VQDLTTIHDSPRPPMMSDVAEAVARYYHVTLGDLRGKSRRASIVRPRQVAYYLCRVLTFQTYQDIGWYFGGRDHTTVMHGVGLVEGIVATPASLLAEQVAMLTRDLRRRVPAEAVA
jgi:chromosomal replication initiator protein